MSRRERYPFGVPCWVESLQPEPKAALDFYGSLFGWEFAGPAPMPDDPRSAYYVARMRDRDVAGICSLPVSGGPSAPVWSTYIRVDSAAETAEAVKRAGGLLLEGPFDVLPAGRMAVVADPAGAPFCIWEAGNREGAQIVNEPGAWAMSMLHSTDPERAKAFYQAVFGWDAESFETSGAQITLWRLPGYVGGEPRQPVPRDVVGVMVPIDPNTSKSDRQPDWSVDFWVDDADATAERALGLRANIIAAPYDTPGFRHAILADPQGAVFSISSLVARS